MVQFYKVLITLYN